MSHFMAFMSGFAFVAGLALWAIDMDAERRSKTLGYCWTVAVICLLVAVGKS